MTQYIFGIDPGVTGALAVFKNGHLVNMLDMPVVHDTGNRLKIDSAGLAGLLQPFSCCTAIVERVASMPGQGVKSVFSFGRSLGIIEGVLGALAIPVEFVSPATWKQALKVPSDKRQARTRASQLLPGAAHWWPLEKHHNRAEAALIGLWGVRQGGDWVEW